MDRSQDQHPDNVIFWRLSSLEEAMKYQGGQLAELRDRVAAMPDQLEREFPTRLEVERDYVSRKNAREAGYEARDVWTLRLVVIGTFVNSLLVLAGLIYK